MKHIAVITEFSFKKAYAPIDKVVQLPGDTIGIADWYNTFGHIPFAKKMKEVEKKPIFGIRCTVCKELKERFEYGGFHVILLAKNNEGLNEIYKLTKMMWDQFYYFPRLSYDIFLAISKDIIVLNASYTKDYAPIISRIDYNIANFNSPARISKSNNVYVDDNNYIDLIDKQVYELMAGSHKRGDGMSFAFTDEIHPQHILSADEAFAYFGNISINETEDIAKLCKAEIKHADMVKYSGNNTIYRLCIKGAIGKEIDLDNPAYMDRLNYEMNLISEKGYDDYFLIVADMIDYAKRNGVLVGPSRGSSAGSLVCYLMSITEIDPIKFNLVFERFIDVNRFDLPDIDIDFPDNKRQMVIKYLIRKYGKDNVATLANINRFKPKSAIGEFAACLFIPPYETSAIKDSIIERSGGDARAQMCILDTLTGTDVGKEFIAKYPNMEIVSRIENHASHAGKHAAGIIVSDKPLSNYGGINTRESIIMMDKKDAEYINLLKIDVLGLRTLTILSECCDMLMIPYSSLYTLPLDDKATYKLFNDQRLSGVFQFEGQALRGLTRQMEVSEFNDICAITSLARPGALNSGGTGRYIKYKTGVESPIYRSETHKKITEESMGIVIYQEQMMSMAKEIGNMSWEDVSNLRKAASKSLGDEFFATFKKKFIKGALENETSEEDAEALWGDISATGSWTFNKSHAVSYGMISYWAAYMKANHPLEFAIAHLNNSKDPDSAIKFLRDIVTNDGIEYVPVDPDISDVNWTVQNGILVGGLTNIDGIGEKKAIKIIKDRDEGNKFTPSVFDKMMNPVTDFDVLFPIESAYGDMYKDPKSYGLAEKPCYIKDIGGKGNRIIIGKVISRDLRDRNDYQSVIKRGGKKVDKDQYYLKIIIEDDTDSVLCMINHMDFDKLNGKHFAEVLIPGKTDIIVKGRMRSDWRMITVDAIAILGE